MHHVRWVISLIGRSDGAGRELASKPVFGLLGAFTMQSRSLCGARVLRPLKALISEL